MDLRVERRDGLVTVTLNRPERKNAMTDDNWRELRDIFLTIADDPDDRVVVLTGEGGDFCAGADLTAGGTEGRAPVLAWMRTVGQAAQAVFGLPKPTIAKVDGVAVGAGCNLALCCDLVVASDRARFSEIFAQRGLSLDFGGSWLLPRLVGLQRAKQLALLGDVVDAATAQRYGLVAEVVPAAELHAFVGAWADRLLAGPPIALSLTKALLESSWAVPFAQALEAEAHAQTVNLASHDAREALAAFAEKRPPVFTGR
ncbi:MAG TPA: enoyl-CoA hydratase [Acidimicrobiales bacterium]|nr:enoyl-CoA hydratase [Acidimicrobiales bacterium]